MGARPLRIPAALAAASAWAHERTGRVWEARARRGGWWEGEAMKGWGEEGAVEGGVGGWGAGGGPPTGSSYARERAVAKPPLHACEAPGAPPWQAHTDQPLLPSRTHALGGKHAPHGLSEWSHPVQCGGGLPPLDGLPPFNHVLRRLLFCYIPSHACIIYIYIVIISTVLGVELHSPLLAGLKQTCARPIRGPARGGGAAINCALSIQFDVKPPVRDRRPPLQAACCQ